MSYRFSAIMSEDGRVTIPSDIRERLGVKAGDVLNVQLAEAGEHTASPVKGRSIFDDLDQFRLPSLGRQLSQGDIDKAVAEEMTAQEDRVRNQS